MFGSPCNAQHAWARACARSALGGHSIPPRRCKGGEHESCFHADRTGARPHGGEGEEDPRGIGPRRGVHVDADHMAGLPTFATMRAARGRGCSARGTTSSSCLPATPASRRWRRSVPASPSRPRCSRSRCRQDDMRMAGFARLRDPTAPRSGRTARRSRESAKPHVRLGVRAGGMSRGLASAGGIGEQSGHARCGLTQGGK